MNLLIFGVALGSVTLNALAQVFLRQTMLTVGSMPSGLPQWLPFSLKLATNYWFIGGMTCYAVSIVLWLAVLGKLQVSQAYPLLSVGYVITAIIGYFFMNEDVNLVRITGLTLIIAGIIVISRS